MSGRSLLPAVATIAALSVGRAPSAFATTFAPQATLAASDEIGPSLMGAAVALSRDGDTALVGGPRDNNGVGAVWVFVRKGSTWTEQAKLTGEGEIGSGEFGTGAALSADGKTALIGGPADNGGLGAAWVFTRSGSIRTQRGSKLTGGGENAGSGEETYCEPVVEVCFVGQVRFGESVALSGDGKTALIGGPGDNANDGATWMFARRASTWTQQGEKLTGGGEQNTNERYPGTEHIGGQFGASVALSANGSTVLVGGPRDNSSIYEAPSLLSVGAAWVFTRSGPTWTQQGGKLRGAYYTQQGASVALSHDGDTALIGGPGGQQLASGAVGMFTRPGSSWTLQSEKLVRTENSEELVEGIYAYQEEFGASLALSSDSSTALVGTGSGKAWAFTRSGTTWIRQSVSLKCGGEGCGATLSGDASTALVGTAVYVDAPPHK